MPSTHEVAANRDVLSPLASFSSRLNTLNGIDTPNIFSRNGSGSSSSPSGDQTSQSAATGVRIKRQ
jgi:hypothetical protein